jgi:hypothetical protein
MPKNVEADKPSFRVQESLYNNKRCGVYRQNTAQQAFDLSLSFCIFASAR